MIKESSNPFTGMIPDMICFSSSPLINHTTWFVMDQCKEFVQFEGTNSELVQNVRVTGISLLIHFYFLCSIENAINNFDIFI